MGDGDEPMLPDTILDHVRRATSDTWTHMRLGGKLRYEAPELLAEFDDLSPTMASDIYALGMTFYALLSSSLPFHEYDNEFKVLQASQGGVRPTKPQPLGPLSSFQGDCLWNLMEEMWSHEPGQRPLASQVHERLAELWTAHGCDTAAGSLLQHASHGIPAPTLNLKSRIKSLITGTYRVASDGNGSLNP